MATGKRKFPSSLLWGGIGVVILLLGVGSALFYLNRGQDDSEGGLGGIQGLMDRFSGKTAEEEQPPAGQAPAAIAAREPAGAEEQREPEPIVPEVRTYTIQQGENLWAIARRGELVDSPWNWRKIVLQNKDKISYASISQDTGDWKVVVKAGKELTVRADSPGEPIEVKKKYALQLLSAPERNLKKAVDIVKMLLADGCFAYLYRFEHEGRIYYRVRVGFYETKEEAETAGRAIHEFYADKKVFPAEYVVFLPSFREMRGERLDFGVQKSHPFVIDFPQRQSREQAMEDLKKVAPSIEFAYIAEKNDEEAGAKIYRARAGYFRSEEIARNLIQEQDAGDGGLWSEAKVTLLEEFREALPGQHINVGKPSS